MNLRNRTLLPVLGSVLVVGIITFLSISWSIKSMVNDRITEKQESIHQNLAESIDNKIHDYHSSLAATERQTIEQSSIFTSLPAVHMAYKHALNGNIDDESDSKSKIARTMLRATMAPYMEGYLQHSGADQFRVHFHLPSSHSLARLWRKGWQTVRNGEKVDISDDLSGFRHMVVQANKNRETLHGVEVGRGGFVVRGICPISDRNEKHLGTVEVMAGFKPLVQKLKATDKENFGVYLKSDLLSIATNLQDSEKYPVIGNQFVYCMSTDPELFPGVAKVDFLTKGMKAKAVMTEGSTQLAAFPIEDYSGAKIGVMLMVKDISDELAALATIKAEGSSLLATMMRGVAIGVILTMLLLGGLMYVNVQRLTNVLNTSISNLTSIASRITSASDQVSSSSNRLADTSGSAAAHLEETSASLTQMASIVGKSNDIAENANNLATEACAQATEGLSAMERMSSSIERIKTSSDSTADIMKTIDEIAFQTNLLALNAAVEAARAGEVGKGFAVVADEVRSLAGRSSNASHDTAGLIASSQESANNGVKVNDEVAEILQNINKAIGDASRMMNEVNTSSSEQTQGINETLIAVNSLSDLTQNNAASSEEIAATGNELLGQCRELKGIVDVLEDLVAGRVTS